MNLVRHDKNQVALLPCEKVVPNLIQPAKLFKRRATAVFNS